MSVKGWVKLRTEHYKIEDLGKCPCGGVLLPCDDKVICMNCRKVSTPEKRVLPFKVEGGGDA